MNRLYKKGILMFALLSCMTGLVQAQDQSAVGLDYLEITGHPLLAEIMLELEPGLLEIYKKKGRSEKRQMWGVRGVARALADDEMYKPMLKTLESVSRPTLLKFKQLPEESYPTLHQVAELVRFNIEYKQQFGVEYTQEEYEATMKLYEALHGKKATD
ncbi:MAG: hypothetical protein K6L74_17135 [Neptuniibacter sp.]